MSDLDIWNNPHIALEQRLELAVIEINKLRSLLSQRTVVEHSAQVMPMQDKNGTEIKAGDTLFNQHDRDQYHTVLEDGEGRLFLGDFDSPLERYAPKKWWEVVHNAALAALSTDELLERLPNNLHLARNDNAPEHDRWRIYNSHTDKYVEPGFPNARDLMLYTIDRLDTQLRDWTGS